MDLDKQWSFLAPLRKSLHASTNVSDVGAVWKSRISGSIDECDNEFGCIMFFVGTLIHLSSQSTIFTVADQTAPFRDSEYTQNPCRTGLRSL